MAGLSASASGKLKIYFAGSIRGGREDVQLYAKIVAVLRKYGTVLTEHVGDINLSKSGSNGEDQLSDTQIHDRDVDWLLQSDVLVAEVTQPSLGVGYEIGRAITANKRILCLFRPDSGRRLSAMIRGAVSGATTFTVKDYVEDEAETILDEYFNTC